MQVSSKLLIRTAILLLGLLLATMLIRDSRKFPAGRRYIRQ